MSLRTEAPVGRILFAIMLVWVTACLDSAAPPRHVDPLTDSLPNSPTGLIVSPPVAGSASTSADSTLNPAAPRGGMLVYVSLVPGTVPSGLRATIRDRAIPALQREVAVVDGGFDPIAIPASLGDTVLVEIERDGDTPLHIFEVVRPRRQPAVVRTSPPAGGRDVPLNAAVIVVFSEPVDSATVTPSSVQLLLGATPVAGTARLFDATGLVALFEPAQLLAPATAYRLAVGQAVRGRNGEALEAPVAVDFTTGSGLTGELASLTVYPDSVEDFFPVTLTITAFARDANGDVLLDATVQWASSDASVAVVQPAWGQTTGREADVTLRAGGVATITATSGGLSDTVFVRSRPVPGELTGSLGVTTATTGMDFDPNGYSFIVAGAGYRRTWRIPENSWLQLAALPVGDYSVTLMNLGSHCAVSGPNPQTVTIAAGAASEVAFAVSCSSAVNGSVRVITVTTGEDFDPMNPYMYLLPLPWDPWGEGAWAAANGSLLLPPLPAGQVGFSLQRVASNCAVVGPEYKTVTVTAGDTTDLTFAVTCAGNLPSVRVTIATTGTDVDPDGYQLYISSLSTSCGRPSWNCGQVPANGSFTAFLPADEQALVFLSGVAENCALIGANDQVVKIVRGATAEVAFAVTCGSGAPSVRVTTATTGGNLDPDGYRVNVLRFGFQDGAPVNGSVSFYYMPPGAYAVALENIEPNCAVSGANTRAVTVADGVPAEVAFDLTCVSFVNGSIRVRTETTGEDLDPDGYTVDLVGYPGYGYLLANGFYTYPNVQPGGYSVELRGVASNCTVSGPSSQTVTVTIGVTADAVFAVTCAKLP